MFGDACEKAMKFTRPVITSLRHYDGTVSCSVGAFIVLNEDGWILSAGHLFDSYMAFKENSTKIKEAEDINADCDHIGRKHRTSLKIEPKWITNHSFWWGWDGAVMSQVHVDRQIDIMVAKLENFDSNWIDEYPVLRDPAKMRPGTSLCRLGFPFSNITATFEADKQAFKLADNTLPLPLFPLEGMHTRNISTGKSTADGIDMLYVETSSPGLIGQSGGPIFDKNGNICGIQLRTNHMPLDFRAEATVDGKKVVENQFLNLGVGLHTKTITEFLRKKGISFNSEDDSEYRIIC